MRRIYFLFEFWDKFHVAIYISEKSWKIIYRFFDPTFSFLPPFSKSSEWIIPIIILCCVQQVATYRWKSNPRFSDAMIRLTFRFLLLHTGVQAMHIAHVFIWISMQCEWGKRHYYYPHVMWYDCCIYRRPKRMTLHSTW